MSQDFKPKVNLSPQTKKARAENSPPAPVILSQSIFHPRSLGLQPGRWRMIGVEAGGRGIRRGEHAARFAGGKLGVLQGCKTFILQNPDRSEERRVGTEC